MHLHRYAAELLGTFLLAFMVKLSVTSQLPLPTPVIAGLTLGLGVYMLGSISGAHLNPAVTIALASVRKIPVLDAVWYVGAQLSGGYIALLAAEALTGVHLVPAIADATQGIVAAEALGAAILVLGVSSVVWGKAPHDAAGLTIGTALALGAMCASTVSAGIVNPAVALALGSFSVAYIVGPIVGGVVAAWGYKAIAKA